MNPFKEHLAKKNKAAAKYRASKRTAKKGLVVDQLLFPESVLFVEYPGMRHDN